jgi:nitrogen fixation/metabolism regulation signal transduction histidine kinase
MGVILRIILILALGFAGIVMVTMTPYWLVAIWIGVLVLLLVIELIRYQQRSMTTLREFLLALRQDDFSSLSTVDEKNREFQEAYRFILEKFRKLRIEKEANYHYLKRVIEHVNTAMVCLKNNRNIQLFNHAAMDLLQVPEIRDLKALEKVDRELASLIGRIRSGEKEMIRFIRHGRIMKLSVRATEFTLDRQLYKIVSLQDIKSELEEQELESWQKLVRVLTHEIMNSAIPITNMVSMARRILLKNGERSGEITGLSGDETEDLVESLSTAESRSQGLAKFVETTRSLSRIPEPKFGDIPLKDLLHRLEKLFETDLEKAGIQLKVVMEQEQLVLKVDPDLIEQVLINLLRNAMDALEGVSKPAIDLSGYKTLEGGMVVRVCDNGKGISRENLDQVFVPFYSTKKKGSGIGLSLSLQIMKLHKGRIDLQSEEGKGTCVSLEF